MLSRLTFQLSFAGGCEGADRHSNSLSELKETFDGPLTSTRCGGGPVEILTNKVKIGYNDHGYNDHSYNDHAYNVLTSMYYEQNKV